MRVWSSRMAMLRLPIVPLAVPPALVGNGRSRTGVYTVGTSERGDAKDRMLIPTPNRMHLEDEVITIAEEFKKVGYRTAQLGKWHLGEDPTTQGIDINVAGNTRGAPPYLFQPLSKP